MRKYSRILKLRLTWWFVWWSICALGLVLNIFSAISAFRYPEYETVFSLAATGFWLVIFGYIVPNKIPATEKLLKKDLKKNPDHLYAKALLLELAMTKQKKAASKEKEDSELRERVKAMEDELAD